MKRLLVITGFVLASFVAAVPVLAQEGPAGSGVAEITFIPAGGSGLTVQDAGRLSTESR